MPRGKVAIGLIVLFVCTWGQGQTLYDGTAGTSPETQGWLSYYSLPGLGIKTVAGGKTTYDSTASNSEQGGFSTHTILGTPVSGALPSLSRASGFTVTLDLKLLSETHASNDRAGLSLIVLSSDLQGIELGFWGNEIWAQSGPSFTHAEGSAYDPTAATTRYDLTIQGSTYALLGNGAPILSGSLRDYSGFGFPYTTPNWIFVGDDTGSARGAFELSRMAIVPEPALLAPAIFALAALRRRRLW